MAKHIRLALWTLDIIWGLKAIAKRDRYLLWRKSLRLYASCLAFTDSNRPAVQLYRAMICAVLTSLFDYDTDWVRTPNPEDSTFFRLLEVLLAKHPNRDVAVKAAKKLFRIDWAGGLSRDGLERGSVSLSFYNVVISSRWMSDFTPQEINDFGRKLQIVDDLLDLDQDRIKFHKNCFLTGQAERFTTELKEFLDSDFFHRLEQSWVYRKLRLELTAGFEGKPAPNKLRELVRLTSPHTGLYAAVVTMIGFRYHEPVVWTVVVCSAVSYALLTWNIMAFNMFVDRDHDVKKGMVFGARSPVELLTYWFGLSAITALSLAGLSKFSGRVALFCFLVWILGLLYSFARRWPIQNAIVALCSASPVLAGSVYAGQINSRILAIFGALFFIILSREIYLDLSDMTVDRGYKATLPIRKSFGFAVFRLIGLPFIWIPFSFKCLGPGKLDS